MAAPRSVERAARAIQWNIEQAGKIEQAGRSGRARTCDPRFWRPVLYQLSYTPAGDLRRRRSAPFQAYGKAEWQGRKRLFERGVHEAAQHGPEVFALARTLRHEHGE